MCGQKYGPNLEKPLRREKKQEWANEKPKLDNARRMRGTSFIDPRQGLSRRMAHSPAMFLKQTCHPHFSSFPRLRANCRVLGPLAPLVSPACLEDRPVQSAPDRPSCRSCRGTRTARGSHPSLLASHLNGPWHVICVQEDSALSLTVPWRRTSA